MPGVQGISYLQGSGRQVSNQIVQMNVCPGEPTDGTGRVCIHLFVQDPRGPFVEPHALHPGKENPRELEARPTRGRLACDPKRKVAPVVRGNVTLVTPRTDDARAVTCPKCMKSPEYVKAMDLLTPAEEK